MSEQNQSQAAPGATGEARPATEDRAYVPDTVGVYGGGRMGAGIAHAFASAGARVIVIENTEETAAAARERVEASIEKSRAKGLEVPGRVEVVRDPTLLDQAAARRRSRPRGRRPQRGSSPTSRSSPPRRASGRTRVHSRSTSSPPSCPAPRLSSASTSSTPSRSPTSSRSSSAPAPRPTSSLPRRTGSPVSARPRSRSPIRPGSRPRASASRSPSRRCAWSKRVWPAPRTSTPR